MVRALGSGYLGDRWTSALILALSLLTQEHSSKSRAATSILSNLINSSTISVALRMSVKCMTLLLPDARGARVPISAPPLY